MQSAHEAWAQSLGGSGFQEAGGTVCEPAGDMENACVLPVVNHQPWPRDTPRTPCIPIWRWCATQLLAVEGPGLCPSPWNVPRAICMLELISGLERRASNTAMSIQKTKASPSCSTNISANTKEDLFGASQRTLACLHYCWRGLHNNCSALA